MTKEEKLVVIDSLAEQLQAYPHFYIADIESLNAEQTAALRRKCFESDVKLVVVKNTLLGKALEKVEKADADLVKVLEGPTSIMFTNVAKAPAVLIKEFRKKSEKPVLKAAFAEGCVYVGDDQLDALCNIKSKEELIGDIIALRGLMQGMETRNGATQVNAFVPLSNMYGYATDLRSKTQGRGQYVMEPSHYTEVPKSIADTIISSRAKTGDE